MGEALPGQQEGRELPDDAVVVRHGVMLLGDMRRSATICHDVHGVYGLSVHAHESMSADDLAGQCKLDHGRICETTAARLREAGFEVQFTFSGNHATIKLPSKPTDALLKRLREAFDGPRANPK